MKRILRLGSLGAIILLATSGFLVLRSPGGSAAIERYASPGEEQATLAPEFPPAPKEHWLNSAPLSLASLRGKVVMLDIWTFECWNCYRSLPWVKEVQKKFEARGLTLIGIHTPEFAHERKVKNVAKKIREFALTYPTMMDNDYVYWKALGNRYWPSVYLIDKRGFLRFRHIGETHSGSSAAKLVEDFIEILLAEPAS